MRAEEGALVGREVGAGGVAFACWGRGLACSLALALALLAWEGVSVVMRDVLCDIMRI